MRLVFHVKHAKIEKIHDTFHMKHKNDKNSLRYDENTMFHVKKYGPL